METLEMLGGLLISFILFYAVGISAIVILLKLFFKPIEDELEDEKVEEFKSKRPRTISLKQPRMQYQ